MRRRSQILLLAIAAISIFVILFSDSKVLAKTYPETVRVGLYFGSSSASSAALESVSGLEIGYYQNGQFKTLLAETGGKQSIIRKDAYFIKSSSGALNEYDPAEGVPYSGETFGPYHIQIGGKLSDFASAQSSANKIKQSGVVAYPAYDNGWAVWTGFYNDAVKAGSDKKNLSSKLGISALTVIEPNGLRLIAYNSNFEPLMIFGSSELDLAARPNASNNPSVLSVNGKQYRGEIEFKRFTDSDMTVINVVNLEQYLYGVVPREIGYAAPIEALKAQAVAARTYTYLNIGTYGKWDFDVVNTQASQVYGGYDAEKAPTNQAVDETKGKKALFNGGLAELFYFSSSGGMTEDNLNVWGYDIPYLKSVSDPYEAGTSYNYNWTRTFTAADIKMKLFLSDVEIGDILSVTAEEYTPAGRVSKLKITGTKDTIAYTNENIRKILGDDSGFLPSRMFTITSGSSSETGSSVQSVITADGKSTVNVYGSTAITSSGTVDIEADAGAIKVQGADGPSTISSSGGSGTVSAGTWVLNGKGWGHAVGMSQEGAKGFAKNGYTYDKILMHYFTGITIE